MKWAVLGGGGCFGLNLARYLLSKGHEVIGCGRSALRGEAHTLGADRMGYRYKVFSIGPDNEFIMEWLEEEKPSVIVNYAAHGEGAVSFKARNWKYFYRTNVVALVELTEMLLGKPWLERFIQISTSELYGPVDRPATEDSPIRCGSPYAASKAAFDMHLQGISRAWEFPWIIVRPSNCMTPGQQMHRVVPKTFMLGLTGRRLELHGSGIARKSYMDATDLSAAVEILAERGTIGDIYNAGPRDPVAIRSLVAMCSEKLEMEFRNLVKAVPDRTGQESCYWIDSSKLGRLGWKPSISLHEAVGSVYAWVKEYLEDLKGLPLEHEMRA